jgi:ferric-dicitrate binding protein FerR (iron transport regulator)
MNEELHRLPAEALTMGSLILKYVKGEISAEEKLLLDAWIAKSERNKMFLEELVRKDLLRDRLINYHKGEQRKSAATEKMMQQVFPENLPVKKMAGRWRNTLTAAAIFLLVAVGAYLWFVRGNKFHLTNAGNDERISADITPGRNGAILKLANGREIILDSVANGVLTQQGSSSIVKEGGQVSYAGPKSTSRQEEVAYNTLTTPRGRQFHVVLPDGSHVWLNAASSIHFPVAFTGNERKVEISGEAYFEVTTVTRPGKGKIPFKVVVHTTSATDGMEVEVLGTHFNINAYSDEPVIKTTLMEGSVKVVAGLSAVLIKPGQQALVNQSSAEEATGIRLANPDMEQVIAWKNGSFYFNDESLDTIMRQLARWYDVEVVDENKKPGVQFVGVIDRNTRLSEVLKLLELNGVHFKIEGKKIIVLSK